MMMVLPQGMMKIMKSKTKQDLNKEFGKLDINKELK